MNNDWRNSDMSYGYRASQQGQYDDAFAQQQRASYNANASASQDYGRYSARHAAPQTQDYGYGRTSSSSYANNGASYSRPQERNYDAGSYSAPSYGSNSGGSSYGTGSYTGSYGAYDSRDSYGASSASYGYASQSYRQSAPTAPAARNYRDAYSQPSYGYDSYRQPSYGSGMNAGYQGYSAQSYAQPSYSQPSYSQPTYSQPAYQQSTQPAYRPAYTQAPSPQQPTYGGSAYAGYGKPQAAPAPAPEQSAAQSYGYASYYEAPKKPEAEEPVLDDVQIGDEDAAQTQPASPTDTRASRPVTPLEKKNQMTAAPKRPASRPGAGDGDLSDDMQSRLERMRRAGEAALRAQGYQDEDATNFMNTGMINLDAAIGSMDENGVDPVVSAQQTARMAVIRQAQMDAPLQQPTTPALRAQNSRPGYSAKKEDGTHEEQRKKSIWRNVIEWVVLLAFAIGAAFLLRAYVLSFYLVQGSSMEPTFYTGQRLLVNKIGYTIGEVERFDTVVCHYPGSDNYYVKRVIGLPGDTVYIEAGQVYVNGQALEETYVDHADETGMMEIVVEEDKYLVFGDNRVDSLDSRSIGAIEEDAIVGRVIAVTWPFSDFTIVKRLDDNVISAEDYVPENAAGENAVDENANTGIGTTDINPEDNVEAPVGADAPEDDAKAPTDEAGNNDTVQ